jgi:hypothetical protein
MNEVSDCWIVDPDLYGGEFLSWSLAGVTVDMNSKLE